MKILNVFKRKQPAPPPATDDLTALEAHVETARRRIHECAADHPDIAERTGDLVATAVALGHAREKAGVRP